MTDRAARSALVSGASRGIGLETARTLAAEGMRVVMLARSEGELRERASEIGAQAIPLRCDVGDARSVTEAAERAREELGAVPDVIVNNAGLFSLAALDKTDPATFRATIDVNLVAPFLIVHAFLSQMRARKRGHIVTIGSIADRNIFPENGAYAASKFGARALHEVLRSELRGTGVRATLVSPAQVDTDLWNEVDPDNRPGFTPRREMLPAKAVAAAVLYAISQPPAVNIDELRLSHS